MRHLEYFVAVAEEHSFTRAAARLHVVQSAVSAGVQALESELGAQVLHRTSREVRLTDTGEIFLPRARETLASAQRAVDAVHEVHGGLRGVLCVGTMTSTGAVDLPAALGQFRSEHPLVTIRVSIRTGGSWELAHAVEAGELDIAVLSLDGRPPAGLIVSELYSSPMCVLVPADHRLANRVSVRLEELAHESFVDFPAGFGSRALVDRAFEKAGLKRKVSVEISDSGAATDYVRHHLGIAVVAEALAVDHQGIALRAIAGAEIRWRVFLALARDRPPSTATRAFEGMLKQLTHDRLASADELLQHR